MIVDGCEVPAGCRLEADVAIIGAGPAGITLAHELMGAGLSVLLLEGGGRAPEPAALDTFRGTVADAVRHPPLALYRVRALGGTSTLWGGRCVPFDPIDFEERPHIPWSGWPLGYDELGRWYRLAMRYCEAGSFAFRADEAGGGLADSGRADAGLERFSPPTDFGRRYRPALARSPEITVVLAATCTGIELAPSGGAVTGLRFASRPGHAFSVHARWTVLAAGALETARLLLASRIGGDNVGRFYMCHLEGKAAVARFRPGIAVKFQYERDREGVYFRRHFAIAPDIQRKRALTNVILRFEPPVIADPGHGDPVLSAMWLSRTFMKPEYERKLASFGYRGAEPPGRRALVAGHVKNVAAGAPGLMGFGLDWMIRHVLASRKLPYVAVRSRDGSFTLDYNAEQVPSPDSRVMLGDDRDAFGLPRLVVDWRVTEQDIAGVLAAHHLLADRLEATGTGRLEVDEDGIRDNYNAIGGHHMGTARMADNASRGVVDRHCRVFGLDNLFIAGAAIFPTSSHANPTLTLVALAARLAEHLREAAECRARNAETEELAEAAE
jgi:choline dehydrogenase-like flavoprotein